MITLPDMTQVLADEEARKAEERRAEELRLYKEGQERNARLATVVTVAEAIADYLRLGLGMAGQAMSRGWQDHWDSDLLPNMSFLGKYVCAIDPEECELDNLHTLAVLQTIATQAADAGPDGQQLARTALSRAVRQALPIGSDYTMLAELVAEAVISNQVIKQDDPRISLLADAYQMQRRVSYKESTWVQTQADIRRGFQDAWADAVSRLDQHAIDHDYCGEYEQAMETILSITDTPGLAYPDRVMETETEVTITYTTVHTVQVTITHPSDEYATDYVDSDDYTHLVDFGDGEVTDVDWETTY